MTLNPDFRGADEVVKPDNAQMGWTDGTKTEGQALTAERKMYDAFGNDMPVATKIRPAKAVNEVMAKKWDEFQVSKGRQPGSNDLSLIDEFVHGKPLLWKPQIIGSCVQSNTFRGLVARYMYETAVLGQPQEYLGRNEFGADNYATYGPFTYGMARRRANMRGGDGLYCAPMAASMAKDGILRCNSPKLKELLARLNANRDTDFPEPQNARLYRAFGKWQYLDELKDDADFTVMETPSIRSLDQLVEVLWAGKPAFVCSGEAIHKVGEHRDGFAIHARNPRDSWAHNMCFIGIFKASDGELFIRETNESWGGRHMYTRRAAEVGESFRRNRLSVAAIGETNAPMSRVPIIGG